MLKLLILPGLFLATFVHGQQTPTSTLKPERAKAIIDTEITSMVNEVSADSIKSYILKMVAFGTRHSLSDTVSQNKGIGAARRWVAGKFRQFAQRHRADMRVELDPFVVMPDPRHPRVPYPITMKNVVATLRGSDPDDSR